MKGGIMLFTLAFTLVAGLKTEISNDKKAESYTVSVEKQAFTWRTGAGQYQSELIAVTEQGYSEPGDFHILKIRTPDGREMTLGSLNGEKHSFQSDNASLLESKFLFLAAGGSKDKAPLLFFQEYAFASSPGLVTIIALDPSGYPQVALREQLDVIKITDYDHDGHLDLLARSDYGQCVPEGCSYVPFLVYVQNEIDGHTMFEINEELSKKLSAEKRYPWAGISYSENQLVYREGEEYKLRKAERPSAGNAVQKPVEKLIAYHIGHTSPVMVQHALVDDYDSLLLLKTLNNKDLELLVKAIFARRGRVFQRKELQSFLEARSWPQKDMQPGSAEKLNGVDLANLSIIEMLQGKKASTVLKKFEELLSAERQVDWNINAMKIPDSPHRAEPRSLGGMKIGDVFTLADFEKRFGPPLWAGQIAFQPGKSGGKTEKYFSNLYLFQSLSIRTQKNQDREVIYAVYTDSPMYRSSDGIGAGVDIYEVQKKIPWILIKNKEKGLLIFDTCDDFAIFYEKGAVTSIMLTGCDRYRP